MCQNLNPSTVDIPNRHATIHLDAGEIVNCTNLKRAIKWYCNRSSPKRQRREESVETFRQAILTEVVQSGSRQRTFVCNAGIT